MTQNGGNGPFKPGSPEYNARWSGVAQGQYTQPAQEGIYAPSSGFEGYPFSGRGEIPLAPGLDDIQRQQVEDLMRARGWATEVTREPRGLGTMGVVGNGLVFTPVNNATITQELIRIEQPDYMANVIGVSLDIENLDPNPLATPVGQARIKWGSGGRQNTLICDITSGTILSLCTSSLYVEAITPQLNPGTSAPVPAICRISATASQGPRSSNHNIVSTDYDNINGGADSLFAVPPYADAVRVTRAPTDVVPMRVTLLGPAAEVWGDEVYAINENMVTWLPLGRQVSQIRVSNTLPPLGAPMSCMVTFRITV